MGRRAARTVSVRRISHDPLDGRPRYPHPGGIPKAGPWGIEVGWLMEDPREVPAPFVTDVLPEGVYLVGWHDGPHSRIRETTVATMAWGEANFSKPDVTPDLAGDLWACWYEVYLTEPMFGLEGPAGAVEVCFLVRR